MMWKSNLSLSNLICRKWREKHYNTECLEVHHNYLHVQTPLSRFRHTVNNNAIIIILCPYIGTFIQEA